MGRLILSALLLAGSTLTIDSALAANELDRDSKMANVQERAKTLPKTVVIRVQDGTGNVEVAESNEVIKAGTLPQDLKFKPVAVNMAYDKKGNAVAVAELDKDRGAETWFYVGYGRGIYYPGYWAAGYGYAYGPYSSWAMGGWGYSLCGYGYGYGYGVPYASPYPRWYW